MVDRKNIALVSLPGSMEKREKSTQNHEGGHTIHTTGQYAKLMPDTVYFMLSVGLPHDRQREISSEL